MSGNIFDGKAETCGNSCFLFPSINAELTETGTGNTPFVGGVPVPVPAGPENNIFPPTEFIYSTAPPARAVIGAAHRIPEFPAEARAAATRARRDAGLTGEPANYVAAVWDGSRWQGFASPWSFARLVRASWALVGAAPHVEWCVVGLPAKDAAWLRRFLAERGALA